MPYTLSRAAYAEMFGPTTGDRVRLGDTDLLIEVERDLTVYGDEVKFGGGKVIRDGMGQSQVTRAQGAMDTVITNALILDHQGVIKADVGLRDGRIAAIGKAGNPDTQPGVTVIIGPGTEIIAGEGRILTPGGFDAHIHFICPQQVDDERVGDHGIDRAASPRHLRLPHAVADHLAAAELHLLAIGGEVLLHLDEQFRVGEAHLVASCRAVHGGIGGAGDCGGHGGLSVIWRAVRPVRRCVVRGSGIRAAGARATRARCAPAGWT